MPPGNEVRNRIVHLKDSFLPPLRVVARRSEDRRRETEAHRRRELLKTLEEIEDAGARFVDEPVAHDPGFADQAVFVVRMVVVSRSRGVAPADAFGHPIFLERIGSEEKAVAVIDLGIEARVAEMPRLRCVDVDVERRISGRRPIRDADSLILVAAEEERLVAHDRSAERQPILRLMERRHRAREPVRGVHLVVAEEVVPGSVKRVRAGLRHRVDHRAGDAAVFGIVAVGQHLDLGDNFLAVTLRFAARALSGHAQAVHLVARRIAARCAGANIAEIAARARHDRDQIQPVASVERQLLHLLWIHVARQVRLLRVDERSRAAHRHRLLQRGQFHRQVDGHRLADAESEPFAHRCAEAAQLRFHFVGSQRHGRHQVRAVLGGHGHAGCAGFDVHRGYRDTGQDAAAFIGDGAAQIALSELREGEG